MKYFFFFVTLILVILSGRFLQSQEEIHDSRQMIDARTHYNTGIQLFDSGDYRNALQAFKSAYQLSPHYLVLHNIALAQSLLGHYCEAIKNFNLYIQDGGQNIGAEKQQEILLEIDRLNEHIGNITIIMEEPESGTLSIDGGEGNSLTVNQTTSICVLTGGHRIEVRAPGYKTLERNVHVFSKSEVVVHVGLEPEIEPCTVNVTTSVPHARIFLDNEEIGTTPLENPITVTPGQMTLEARRPGYENTREKILLRSGDQRNLHLQLPLLARMPNQFAGRLEVELTEKGRPRILIDGTQNDTNILPIGMHHVEVQLRGFHTWTGQVNIDQGQTSHLLVQLNPIDEYLKNYSTKARRFRLSSYVTGGLALTLLGVATALQIWNGHVRRQEWHNQNQSLLKNYQHFSNSPDETIPESLFIKKEQNDELAKSISSLDSVNYGLFALGGTAAIVALLLYFLGPKPHRYDNLQFSIVPQTYGVAFRLIGALEQASCH